MSLSESLPSTFADLDERLGNQVGTSETPSIVYGVWVDGNVVHQAEFGLANPELGQKATVDTPYALASISKPITAAAVMVLAEAGKLEVDRPINDYLGNCRIRSRAGDADSVTIRQVVTHSAGLPLHYQFFYEDEDAVRPPFSQTTQKFAKTFWIPGERFVYSNLGYGLLDALIERVTGKPYPFAMEELVFSPLGMKGSSIDGTKGGEALSIGPDGVAYPRYSFDHPGGSAVYASVNDLVAFGQSFIDGVKSPILSSAGVKEVLRQTYDFGPSRGWGFGWSHNSERLGLNVWQHDGGMGGVRTVLRLLPDSKTVIAVLSNGESPLPARTVDEICGILNAPARQRLLEERESLPPAEPPIEFPTELVGVWKGGVECGEGLSDLTVSINGSGMAIADWQGQSFEVSESNFIRGQVTGVFNGSIPDLEASRRPHRIHLELILRDNRLQGAAIAISTNPDGSGGAKGKRMGNALSFWSELTKV